MSSQPGEIKRSVNQPIESVDEPSTVSLAVGEMGGKQVLARVKIKLRLQETKVVRLFSPNREATAEEAVSHYYLGSGQTEL